MTPGYAPRVVSRDEALIRRVGANVRSRRLERGWSQAELARQTGLAVSEISRIERGVREVRITTLLRVVTGLEVDPADLLVGVRIEGSHSAFRARDTDPVR